MTTATATGLTTPKSHLSAFSEVESTLPGIDRPGIARQRRAAIARFGEQGFPTDRNEDWKFTSVAPIVRTPMQLASAHSPGVPRCQVKGVLIETLENALARHPELVEPHLGQYARHEENPFVALNTAFWRDGLFVHIPDGVVVEEPLRLDYLLEEANAEAGRWHYRRTLIVLGKNSQATIAEGHGSQAGKDAIGAVTEIVLGEGAILDHYKVQEESREAFHLSTTQVIVPAKATFSTHYIGLGAALARNEVRVLFTGERAEATVNGLYVLDGNRHADNHTVIDHARAHCASHELYKGVLDGRSRGVFNGKIFVRQDAQKTDAKQTNQTLLLSDDATINTKPQLEIFADDVKCTHGATVGQLDEQQLFYLRARGIGQEQARALLTFAFANDIIGRIKVSDLRERLERALLATSHLPPLDEIESE